MEKTIKKLTAILLLTLLFPVLVFGASSSASLSGSSSVQEGDTVTITVTYKGDSLGYVNGQLTYDTSKLEYISGGTSQGNAGLVELKSYADNADGKMSFKLRFKAVGSGSVSLNLETLETQNLDGDQDMGSPSASKTVNIAEKAETQTTESTEADITEPDTESDTEMYHESSTVQTQNSESVSGDISYPLIGIIAAVLLILIVLIIKKLKKKR